MLNDHVSYDNAFEHDNVYGHAVELLGRHLQPSQEEGAKVHLDVGCGFGRIAEVVRDRFQLHYVGIDANEAGLESLRDRGFECHRGFFEDFENTLALLRGFVGSRQLASVTFLDTLEHLPHGDAMLRAIAALMQPHSAILIASVPNVTHRDIGSKLALGRWDYTPDGLLDHTHVRLFSEASLQRTMRAAGLHQVGGLDVEKAISDQHFPQTHPALASGTTLRELFDHLGSRASRVTKVNQFVRAYLSGPAAEPTAFLATTQEKRPFLSVLTRTQGTRPECLVEVQTCLAGQTDSDFEWIVVGHKLNTKRQKQIERILDAAPEALRRRTKLVLVDSGNRTHPLNRGFEVASGEYVSILDDDDIVFGHWIETFRELSTKHPGRLLRAVSVRQNIERVQTGGRAAIRAVETLEKLYPSSFDLFEHLRVNSTPPVSVAFPRGPFFDLGIHFDEQLTTTEDWDYILRVALVVGVASSEKITSVYHWWDDNHQSSRTDHAQTEWQQNHAWIFQKQDSAPLLLPAGSSRLIRQLLDERDERTPCGSFQAGDARDWSHALSEVLMLLASTSWQLTKPLRLASRLCGAPSEIKLQQLPMLTTQQLRDIGDTIRHSRSWQFSAPVRRLKGFKG
ncbi:methyltransferase domain-containing protein [Tianweitania populi]|uniref:Methyltransferase domain-containing protein n=1 Tax=Tianweitania populi TaxID=1607949 RepID=A0A8J3DYZ3_9HYPH|nr:methyltransferase domain-containing protein [Tianweitania populi]GHD21385.1 hypothetical protein GCM10016234_34980 [Tianweitania populi]